MNICVYTHAYTYVYTHMYMYLKAVCGDQVKTRQYTNRESIIKRGGTK